MGVLAQRRLVRGICCCGLPLGCSSRVASNFASPRKVPAVSPSKHCHVLHWLLFEVITRGDNLTYTLNLNLTYTNTCHRRQVTSR